MSFICRLCLKYMYFEVASVSGYKIPRPLLLRLSCDYMLKHYIFFKMALLYVLIVLSKPKANILNET